MTDDGVGSSSGWQSWWVLAAMVLIGSSTATAAKFAVSGLPVALVPVVRFGGAGFALLPLVWGRGAIRRLIREDGPTLLAAALLCVPVNQGFFLNGARLAPTTHVGLIYATCPIFVLLLSVGLKQERWHPTRVLGVLVCVVGAGVIALGGMTQAGVQAKQLLVGDVLLVGAVVSWAGYVTVNKRLLMRHPALPVLAATFLIGAALSLPLALATAPRWAGRLAGAGWPAWIGLIYLTLVASVLGLACQNLALRRFDASHVAAVGNLSPALTILWGVWLLGETVTPALVVGGLLTVGGVALASRPIPANPASCPAPHGVPGPARAACSPGAAP
ncbi:MAG: permease [Isosphaeraceae bacterium]|nr:MAG: permease [Isosphaeraceae bacterium]